MEIFRQLVYVVELAALVSGPVSAQGPARPGPGTFDARSAGTGRSSQASPARLGPLGAADFLHVDGERIVDGRGREVLLRGIGLGGWMLQEPYMFGLSGVVRNQTQIKAKITDLIGPERTERFYTAWRASQFRKSDMDSLRAWGFNSIRVPLHYRLFTLSVAEEPVKGRQTWLRTGFDLMDSLVSWARADHIWLILDLHAAPGGQGNDFSIADRDPATPSLWQDPENQRKMVALWKKLAQRYSREYWIGGYDILNETNWGFTDPKDEHGCAEKNNGPLRALLVQTTDTIRSVDKNHMVIIEGNCWCNNYNGIFPLWDSNLVISFHKYWNFNDVSSIQHMLDLRASLRVPLWLGESGENSNTWTTDAIALMESHDIGWCWWPLKKAGLNNPLEIQLPEGFRKIREYWRGQGPRPDTLEAYHALMELALNARSPQNIEHRDVIDAMFRQVETVRTEPFVETQVRNGTKVFAVNYDLGRNGYAYYDLDTANFHVSTGKNSAWNSGGVYRNDGVDIEPDTTGDGRSPVGGGSGVGGPGNVGGADRARVRSGVSGTQEAAADFDVAGIQTGEWMQYTVDVSKAGYYLVRFQVSPGPSGASWDWLEQTASGYKLLDSITIAPTVPDPPGEWEGVTGKAAYLGKGAHRFRFRARSDGFIFRYIEFLAKTE